MAKFQPYTEADIRRKFLANLLVGDGCWEWEGNRYSQGYGRVTGAVRAHTYSYELLVGPVPEGLELDHLCRVRHCVRPDHLEAVTSAENIRRGNCVSAINARKTHCKRGHELGGDNLLAWGLKKGERICRTCTNEQQMRPEKREYRRAWQKINRKPLTEAQKAADRIRAKEYYHRKKREAQGAS